MGSCRPTSATIPTCLHPEVYIHIVIPADRTPKIEKAAVYLNCSTLKERKKGSDILELQETGSYLRELGLTCCGLLLCSAIKDSGKS